MAIAGFDNTYQKIMNSRERQTLKSLILMSLLERKRSCHFSTLIGKVSNLVPKSHGGSETRELVKMRLKKHNKKSHNKTSNFIQNWSERGSQKSDSFVVFQGSIPAWSLGRPWGGSRAQKPVKMEARTWIFYILFRDHAFTFFADSLEIFSCVP